jgi:hypothetical protein
VVRKKKQVSIKNPKKKATNDWIKYEPIDLPPPVLIKDDSPAKEEIAVA